VIDDERTGGTFYNAVQLYLDNVSFQSSEVLHVALQ